MAQALLQRVEVVEQRVEVSGTDAEKETLLPKLEDLRKAIGDMTAYYDARLAEVKERNLQALQELQKLDRRVKARAPENKENQENSDIKPKPKEKPKEKVRAEKKVERFAPLLAPRPRAPVAWEQELPWEHVHDVDVPWDAWSLPHCTPYPTGQAEFFPVLEASEIHTDQLWSPAAPVRRSPGSEDMSGSPPILSASPALTFIPTPSPEWEDGPYDVAVGSLLRARSAD
jgi:hypothetical protein